MEIPKNLKDEIWGYCRINNISNIDDFILKLIKQGFTIEKYGATPKEKIVEKKVEIPIEKIVEKEVYITDDKELKQLTSKVFELEKHNKELITEIDATKKLLEEEKSKNKRDFYGEN